jgi:Fic family protein
MKLPETPPALRDLLERGGTERLGRVLSAGIRSTVDGRYRHWDNVRQLTPPPGLSLQDWWFGIKLARMGVSRELPITDMSGHHFTYTTPDEAAEALHDIDQRASGTITVSEIVTTESAQRRYLVNSLIEESISSSQLEGASTTKRVAKEMIRAGREPRDRSERMIFNNYRAMNLVREWAGDPMTFERLLELHRIVTDGTLDDPSAAGRIQTPDDERVVVTDRATGEVTHDPPPAEQLPERLEKMLEWANGGGSRGFVHPVLRSIVLHLWLAYDHPFEDGNGRTARALFYWSMLSQGYRLTEWLSISSILNKAPAQYARSFLLTETDELDATYFVLYQLSVIRRAIDELHAYLRRKMSEVRDTERLMQSSDLNYRQIALVGNALRHPDASFTYRSHSTSHRVALESARLDLLDLENRGFLTKRRVGRQMVFHPVANLEDLLTDRGRSPA